MSVGQKKARRSGLIDRARGPGKRSQRSPGIVTQRTSRASTMAPITASWCSNGVPQRLLVLVQGKPRLQPVACMLWPRVVWLIVTVGVILRFHGRVPPGVVGRRRARSALPCDPICMPGGTPASRCGIVEFCCLKSMAYICTVGHRIEALLHCDGAGHDQVPQNGIFTMQIGWYRRAVCGGVTDENHYR